MYNTFNQLFPSPDCAACSGIGVRHHRNPHIRVMDECLYYDNVRVKRMNNPIEYDLLERKLPDKKYKWSPSDWFRFIDEHRGKPHE